MPSQKQLDNLRAIARAAVTTERATGVPAELITAQCIWESGWLTRAPGNNPFGIKAAKRHGQTQMIVTHEVCQRRDVQPEDVIVAELDDGRVRVRGPRAFAAYSSLAAAFADHALLIATGRPYSLAWQRFRSDGDLEALIEGVAHVYATDPGYAAALKRVLSMTVVQAAIQDARGVAPATSLA